jgi:hypothetical protein
METLVCLQCGVWLLRLTWLTLGRLKLCRHTSAIPHASIDTVLTVRDHCQVDQVVQQSRPLPVKKALPRRHSRQEACWPHREERHDSTARSRQWTAAR